MKAEFFNRELSWLEFNQRVLDEARNGSLPLLERTKFLAITASNLDEFFMVRVGGLSMLKKSGSRRKDPAGMTPHAQLVAIASRVRTMIEDQERNYLEELEPGLQKQGIRRVRPADLTPGEITFCSEYFDQELFPILSPVGFSEKRAPSLIKSRLLHLAVRLRKQSHPGSPPSLAMLPLGPSINRFVALPSTDDHRFILVEDLVAMFIERFFEGHKVIETAACRITRNADMSVQEDKAPDLLSGMEGVLEARITSTCVRLELASSGTHRLERDLKALFELEDRFIYRSAAPIHFGDFMNMAFMSGFDHLKIPNWPPLASPNFDHRLTVFENLQRGDLLLIHPYESFDPVVSLVQQAAEDPDVLAIKQILYRTSAKSPMVQALVRAAEKGKYVTVLIELKARFDEQRNIDWARELELAGVQVIYGIRGLKTHAKLLLIVRRETSGLQRYMHFGTGNYNESTARLYGDVSYMTCNTDLGLDASTFFNTITGFSQPQSYKRIEAAPISLRDRLLRLIEREIDAAKNKQRAQILVKVNSLVDPVLIEALYKASKAGVEVLCNIRGICCLVPGKKGLSENIRVVSIVDRFLEHARVMYFENGGSQSVWISSADWMPRNLDKRIELLTPIRDRASAKRIIQMLGVYFKDNHNAWELNAKGKYIRLSPGSKKTRRSQEILYKQTKDALNQAVKTKPLMFEPHTSTSVGS
jgi:polyphosphate kinase